MVGPCQLAEGLVVDACYLLFKHALWFEDALLFNIRAKLLRKWKWRWAGAVEEEVIGGVGRIRGIGGVNN